MSRGYHPRAGRGDYRAPGRGGFNPARSVHAPDTGGKAGLGREPAPPAIQQAVGETLPRLSSEVGLRALRGAEIQTHRWAARVSGQGSWRTWCSNTQEEEEGQRGEEPVAALMLLSTAGYLRAEEDGKQSGYPCGRRQRSSPCCGGPLNPSPLLQAFPAHLSVCLCERT